VWFRDSCADQAHAQGVAGSVRNLADGRVEAVFEGAEVAVQAMVAWCRTGPPRARVTEVAVQAETPVGERGFSIV
jgi:acylphosphatase